jgi:hypothetical protein
MREVEESIETIETINSSFKHENCGRVYKQLERYTVQSNIRVVAESLQIIGKIHSSVKHQSGGRETTNNWKNTQLRQPNVRPGSHRDPGGSRAGQGDAVRETLRDRV